MKRSALDIIKARLEGHHGEITKAAEAIGISRDKLSKSLSGTRKFSADELLALLDYFDADDDGAPLPLSAHEQPTRPWRPDDLPEASRDAARAAVQFLCGNARAPGFLEVRESAPAFGLLSGDVVIIDGGRPPCDGDIVAVQVVDEDSGEAIKTMLARFVGGFLVEGEPDMRAAATAFDSLVMSIAGPVIASFRAAR